MMEDDQEDGLLAAVRMIGARRPSPLAASRRDDDEDVDDKSPAPSGPTPSVQIDLNDPAALESEALEDKGLVERMNAGRQVLAKTHADFEASLRDEKKILEADAEAKKKLSILTLGLREQKNNAQNALEDLLCEASNVGKMRAGGTPHGYPAGPADDTSPDANKRKAEQLQHLEKRLNAIGSAFAEIIKEITALECELTLGRRACENAFTGLQRLASS